MEDVDVLFGGRTRADQTCSTLGKLLKAPGNGLKQFREHALLQSRMFQRFHRVIVWWVKAFPYIGHGLV